MSEFLEAMVDKFSFKVATDRLYTADHLWLKMEDELVLVGLTDYLQQTAGDVAFAEPRAVGITLASGEELANIETMKTTLDIPAPLAGVIQAINSRLKDEPELVNQDPYGQGWLVKLEVSNWETVRQNLLEPDIYYEIMKAEATAEAQNQ